MIECIYQHFGRCANRAIRLTDRLRLSRPGDTPPEARPLLESFAQAASCYASIYGALRERALLWEQGGDPGLYAWPSWEETLANDFSECVPISFTKHPLVQLTMVFQGRLFHRKRRSHVIRAFGHDIAREILEEDPIGGALVIDREWYTSANRLYHAFHLAKYFENTGKMFPRAGTIIEWGGGYGDMARILWRLGTRHGPLTLVLIDLPALGALQWVYLTSLLGGHSVKIVTSSDQPISKGCVNIMSSAVALSHSGLEADAFLSTWALTESPHELQARVLERHFFGAKDVLLAFSMDSDNRVAESLRSTGGIVTEVPYLRWEGNSTSSYGFMACSREGPGMS